MEKVSNWIIKSKEFFFIAMFAMVFMSVLSILLFLFDVYQINGYLFSESMGASGSEQALLWSRVFLTAIGSTLAVLSILMVNRHDKNFFYFGVTGTLILACNGFISQLMFDALKWLIVASILATQAVVWHVRKDHDIKFKRISPVPLLVGILVVTLVSFAIGYGLVSKIPSDSLFYNKKPVLDPIQFSFTVIGNILIMLYFIESRIVFMIGNVITMSMYGMIVIQGDLLTLIQLTQATLYLIITIAGFVTMKLHYHNSKEIVIKDGDLCSICIGPTCEVPYVAKEKSEVKE